MQRKGLKRWQSAETIILVCLLVLPYLSYVALLGLTGYLAWSLAKYCQAIGTLLLRQGWLWVTVGFVLNVAVSFSPGESALQTLNFVPFFVFYAAIAITLPGFAQPLQTLYRWAVGLVVATIPISLRAAVEFYFNAPASIQRWSGVPWLDWLYSQPDFGHRADSVFGHPNVLANYLVVVFGLGLGLCAYYLQQSRRYGIAPWVYGAVCLLPVGIFCSGSRNGLLIVGLQLLVFGWWMRRYRFIVFTGAGTMLAMFLGVLAWGVGGRTLAQAFSTITLRFDVWRLAYGMIFERPWLGSGLGTFKLLYEPFAVPEYDYLHHPHNLVLTLAVEVGIPLAVLFISVVGVVVYRGIKAIKVWPSADPGRAILVGYGLAFGGHMAFAMFDLSFYDSRVNVLGWLLLGVIQGISTLPSPLQPSDPLASPSQESSPC